MRETGRSTVSQGRVQPQATELEGAVLGVILTSGNSAFETAADILQGEYVFYKDAHQRVWTAFREMDAKGMGIELLTVRHHMATKGDLELVGGMFFLTKLTADIVSSSNFEEYCRVVQERYLSRELIQMCGETTALAYDNEDVFDLLHKSEEKIFELSVGKISANYTSINRAALESMEEIYRQREQPGKLLGVTSGYSHLDRLVNGWQAPDFIVIGARPSVGKTAFALNLALNAAKSQHGVGFFSLEMSTGQIMKRIQSMDSLVQLEAIRTGNLTDTNIQQLERSVELLTKLNIQIDDTAGLNIYQLRAKARRMKAKHDIKLVIIDYLQLMRGVEEKRPGIREQEVAKISRELKMLAKSLGIPVIALSQLNRGSAKESAKPTMSDLRESGAIEQDADIVGLLSRTDYQKKEGEISRDLQNKAALDIVKHRSGKLDELVFETDHSTQRWMEPDFGQYDNPGRSFRRVDFSEPTKEQHEDAPF